MGLRDFVRREGVADATALTIDAWEQLEGALEGASVLDLARQPAPETGIGELPAPTQRALLFSVGRYLEWRRSWATATERMAVARPEETRAALLDATLSPSELEALLDWLPGGGGERLSDEAWVLAWSHALELRRCCLGVALRDAVVRSQVHAEHPQSGDFDDLAGYQARLEELPPHRWMALRRGESLGALSLAFTLPEPALREQFALLEEELSGLVAEPGQEDAFSRLVVAPLPSWLRVELGERASRRSIEGACRTYADLLAVPATKARKVAGLFVGGARSPIGLASVDGAGEVKATARIAPTEGWQGRVESWLQAEEVRQVALPTHAPATELLGELRRRLAKAHELVIVRPAGVSEARERLLSGRQRMSPEAASAAVLAMRVAQPAVAWRAVDPVRLGLAEYQGDLDESALAEALRLTRAVADRMGLPMARPAARIAGPAGSWDTPLVKSMADLRPGMMVPAVITNITNFGAFADIGVGQQGLIHISDLADHFVQDPAEVVRTGQQVRARVLGVDTARGRISLSLKSEAASPARPGPRVSSGRPGGSVGGGKSQALRDLERLFDR